MPQCLLLPPPFLRFADGRCAPQIALADGRALLTSPFAMIHAGHGNAQFALGNVVALAQRFNMLPVIPCRKFAKLHTSPFFNFHCVDTRYVKWKGIGDGSNSHHGLTYQKDIERRSSIGMHTSISGYSQEWSSIGYGKSPICWAQRPDLETQKQTMKYWRDVVLVNITEHMNEHTTVVAVHVRRGDYVSKSKKEVHGALGKDYYRDSWYRIQGRIGLNHPQAAENIVVLVFAASNSIEWARAELKDTFRGAKVVSFVNPHQKGRGAAADIDILAMSLADYYILANSTFCWWAQFYSDCRKRFAEWWALKSEWGFGRKDHNDRIIAMPHRWHKARDKRFPITYNFMQTDYVIAGTQKLYEGFDD